MILGQGALYDSIGFEVGGTHLGKLGDMISLLKKPDATVQDSCQEALGRNFSGNSLTLCF